MIQIDDKVLITTDDWFIAPDGQWYKAVFGTIKGARKDKEFLGIETNRHSTNWYLEIGNMTIAGCQIHYAVKTKAYHSGPVESRIVFDNCVDQETIDSRIYNADQDENMKKE